MKQFCFFLLRSYLKIGLFFYFGKIRVGGLNRVIKNKPNIILCNHQNALLDALLIATTIPDYPYFLTRASVFKNRQIDKFLRFIRMLPVYRMRDGWANLTHNNEIFSRCKALLESGNTIVIFPEGSHNLARKVRPLSKGFTRIVFDYLDDENRQELYITPAGVNYRNAVKFPDSTRIQFGDSFLASQFKSENLQNSVVDLKQVVHGSISKLTVHIPGENYENIQDKLSNLNADFLEFENINRYIEGELNSTDDLAVYKIPIYKKLLKALLILLLLIPFLIWRLMIKPKVVEKEFISTFRFAVAVVLVPIYFIILLVMAISVLPLNWVLAYVALTLIIDIILLKT